MLGVNSNPTPGPTSGGGTFNLSGTGVINMTLASGATGDGILMIGRSDVVANNTTNSFNQTGGTANIGILAVGGAIVRPAETTRSFSFDSGQVRPAFRIVSTAFCPWSGSPSIASA